MVKKIIKFIYIFLVFFLLFKVEVFGETLNLNSDKYILYNLNDNIVLLNKNENQETYIASLTKMMTVIVAIENIEDYNKEVIITKEMFKDIAWDVSVAGFKVGEKVTYNDLLYGAILPSGADAVNALALSISGSYDGFIELMNQKAKDLSLKHTHFANVTGLFNENNYSSAYDVAEILKYALKNKKFKEVFETKRYTLSNGKIVKSTIESYNSRNGGKNISYIKGAKTGFINAAGYCLASTSTIDGVDYLLVTLNADKSKSAPHISDAITAYTYFSKNYSYMNIVDNSDVIVDLKAKNSKEKEIKIKSNVKIDKYLKNDFSKENVKYIYDGVKEISYFTKKGTVLGKVDVMYGDKKLDTFDLVYSGGLTFSIFAFMWNNLFLIIFISFALFISFRIVQLNMKRKKRLKRKLQTKC